MTVEEYNTTNEQLTAHAFSAQAPLFDGLYGKDGMIAFKRAAVRSHIEKFLLPGSQMLELNAGTGEDAMYFAKAGHSVHATDVSASMLLQLSLKSAGASLNISHEQCSYHSLETLSNKGPFDHIFSNFAGLNCTGNLDQVISSLHPLLKENGHVTFVLLPSFCLWEVLMLFKGKFKTAFRRFFAKNGRKAFVEGKPFTCWYYDPSYVAKHASDLFVIEKMEGLCTIVPPSYIEGFDKKYPRVFKNLCALENKLKTSWPWKSIGDYYIITLRKK